MGKGRAVGEGEVGKKEMLEVLWNEGSSSKCWRELMLKVAPMFPNLLEDAQDRAGLS